MPTTLRVSRALARSLGPALLLAIVFLLAPQTMFGQHVTGFILDKTCPSVPVAPGSTFNCTYTLTNQDTLHGVISLVVTNQAPFPGGPIAPIDCTQGGVAVTSLGVNGTLTDTCTGSAQETAPGCGSTNTFFNDEIAATGEDAGIAGLPISASATNAVVILACTPTPTNTPINTPTNTPINSPTPTNTPPEVAPPSVPTLSFPMMALLGLILAGAGLFLARRH
jgi:hypothetical protein